MYSYSQSNRKVQAETSFRSREAIIDSVCEVTLTTFLQAKKEGALSPSFVGGGHVLWLVLLIIV